MLARRALALGLLLCASACAQTRTVILRPTAQANQGRHFYVLVRSASEKDFFADSYKKIAGMVFPSSSDPTVLMVKLVWPGRAEKLTLKLPSDQAFAIYALFTDPDEPWKLLMAAPLEKEYELVLDAGRITQVRPAVGPPEQAPR